MWAGSGMGREGGGEQSRPPTLLWLRRSPTLSASLFPRSSALMESLINPLQDRIEDWKKTANQLDKDHAKGRGGTGWIRAGVGGGHTGQCWGGSPL